MIFPHLLPGFDEDDDDDEMETEEGAVGASSGGARPAPLTGLKNPEEKFCREGSRDYGLRFCGHCNTTTDIKEANFFGSEGQFVVAGSDDGMR